MTPRSQHEADIASIKRLKKLLKHGRVDEEIGRVVVQGTRAMVRQMSELTELNLRLDDIAQKKMGTR